jgi:hypothetical protein
MLTEPCDSNVAGSLPMAKYTILNTNNTEVATLDYDLSIINVISPFEAAGLRIYADNGTEIAEIQLTTTCAVNAGDTFTVKLDNNTELMVLSEQLEGQPKSIRIWLGTIERLIDSCNRIQKDVAEARISIHLGRA